MNYGPRPWITIVRHDAYFYLDAAVVLTDKQQHATVVIHWLSGIPQRRKNMRLAQAVPPTSPGESKQLHSSSM
ncbi:MAG: hypothetical protein ABIW36_02815 [Terrimesophilobacter sp.]